MPDDGLFLFAAITYLYVYLVALGSLLHMTILQMAPSQSNLHLSKKKTGNTGFCGIDIQLKIILGSLIPQKRFG